jgi:predicted enzyme related to lactoylglutathione lyase
MALCSNGSSTPAAWSQKRFPRLGNTASLDRITTPDGVGIPAGISGGTGYGHHTIFYVGVADAEAALAMAESLGGTRLLGPATKPGGGVVVGHFTHPEGNLIGVAGPK